MKPLRQFPIAHKIHVAYHGRGPTPPFPGGVLDLVPPTDEPPGAAIFESTLWCGTPMFPFMVFGLTFELWGCDTAMIDTSQFEYSFFDDDDRRSFIGLRDLWENLGEGVREPARVFVPSGNTAPILRLHTLDGVPVAFDFTVEVRGYGLPESHKAPST